MRTSNRLTSTVDRTMRQSPDELTQLRGVLGALQWRSHQTGPHLSSRLGQLQSEISKATVGTLKAANKLVRECFQTRHLSTRINQIDVSDPLDVCFVAWSDAALANRIDLGSTGGYVIAAANPCLLQGESAPLTFVSWRSGKLARKARSSLSAEAQALSEADQELMFVRLAWSELCGLEADLRNPDRSISQISGTVVVDAKSLFDVLEKRELNSAAVGVKDKYSALEILCLLESIERLKTGVRWVHSEAQVADAMTKPLPPGILHKILTEGRWVLAYDPTFTSAKKLKASKRANSFQDFRGMSVVEPDQPQGFSIRWHLGSTSCEEFLLPLICSYRAHVATWLKHLQCCGCSALRLGGAACGICGHPDFLIKGSNHLELRIFFAEHLHQILVPCLLPTVPMFAC